MESVYTSVRKQNKASIRKFKLGDLWGPRHTTAFHDIKQQLAVSVKLSHPKPNHVMCLFTEGSDGQWASILTEVSEKDQKLDITAQGHEPFCFLSGSFTGSALNWSVPEKEVYAIVESMCRLDYLVHGTEVNIFTDHANLV